MMRLDNPKPVPSSYYIEVSPEDGGYSWAAPLTEEDAQRRGEEMCSEIKRHVDNVASCRVRFDTYTCPLCGQEMDSYREALMCCSIACPTCKGRGQNYAKDEDGILRPHACPDCNNGRVPDPGQWEEYRGEGESA